MQIPEGWKIMSINQVEKMEEKGMEAIEEIAGEIDYSGLKHLIHFQKNQFKVYKHQKVVYRAIFSSKKRNSPRC